MSLRRLSDFEGRWRLSREIVHGDGTQARFTGLAAWQVQGDGMLYSEIGRLEMAGAQPMSAERRYVWDADLNVYFDDGRFFHRVPAAGGKTDHWCDPDQYDVSYDFDPWPVWSCVWTVKGPRKDYRLRSHYVRP